MIASTAATTPRFGSGTESGAASVLAALTLAYLAAQGLETPLLWLILSCAACAYVVCATGRLATRAIGAVDLPLAATWAFGVAIAGPALYVLLIALDISAAIAFAVLAVPVIALDILFRQRPTTVLRRADVIGMAFCCAFTAAWCRSEAAAPATLAASGNLPVWIDHYLHAGVLARFGDSLAIGRGNVWLSDTPWFAYHYASYTLPAAFGAVLDQPGLPISTSVWVPIGFLTLTTAVYTLGAFLSGSAGGFAALIAVFVLPDASNYWLRNGFFSLSWHLLAHPGVNYALASALLAIVMLGRWIQSHDWRTLAACITLAGVTLLFRMHIFLVLFPACVLVLAVSSSAIRRRGPAFIMIAGALAIAAVFALRIGPDLQAGAFLSFQEGRALERALLVIHRRQEPTAYQGLYLHLQTEFGDAFALFAGALLIYPALLGAWLLLLPITLWLDRARVQLRGVDAIPLALLACLVPLLAFAPIPGHGDPTDLIHRPTVLLYVVTAIWCVALLVRWLSHQGAHGSSRLAQTIALAAALGLPYIWSEAERLARPKFHWARPFNAYHVSAEFRAASAFLRSSARVGDTFATSLPGTGQIVVDDPTVLVALTGMPAYLARVWLHQAAGADAKAVASRRYAELSRIEAFENIDDAKRRLRELGLRWYVATRATGPAWDPSRTSATWVRGPVAIYDLGSSR